MVSLANERLPPVKYYYYYMMVDNGMFRYYKAGQRPDLWKWYQQLLRFLRDIDRLRKPVEVAVILPDWLNDPVFTLKAASHSAARVVCKDYDCYIVVHSSPSLAQWIPGQETYYGGYARAALEAAASVAEIVGLAAPLKLNCSRMSNGRRIIKLHCQRAIVEQVCSVARRLGLKCHGLGVGLKPSHVKRLTELGLTSFDSSSWTRPNNSVLYKMAPWSAKNSREKDLFFRIVLERMTQAGVELEGAKEAITHG